MFCRPQFFRDFSIFSVPPDHKEIYGKIPPAKPTRSQTVNKHSTLYPHSPSSKKTAGTGNSPARQLTVSCYRVRPNIATVKWCMARFRSLYRDDFSRDSISHISSTEHPSAIQSRIRRSSSGRTFRLCRIHTACSFRLSRFSADSSAQFSELSIQSSFPSHSIALVYEDCTVYFIFVTAGALPPISLTIPSVSSRQSILFPGTARPAASPASGIHAGPRFRYPPQQSPPPGTHILCTRIRRRSGSRSRLPAHHLRISGRSPQFSFS